MGVGTEWVLMTLPLRAPRTETPGRLPRTKTHSSRTWLAHYRSTSRVPIHLQVTINQSLITRALHGIVGGYDDIWYEMGVVDVTLARAALQDALQQDLARALQLIF